MRTILFIMCLLSSLAGTAQKSGRTPVDSLLQAIPANPDDTVKARLYNKIFNELIASDPGEAILHARAGLLHSQKMKWIKGIAVFQDNLGRAHSNMGNYDSAVHYYTVSLTTNKAAGNKQGMANTYNNLGVAAQNIKADFTKAADHYFQSLHITEELQDSTGQANALINIASIYMLQKNYEKALDFNKRSLQIREKLGKLQDVAASSQSIGKTWLLLKDTLKARQNFQKGLSISESIADLQGMAAAWSNLPLTYRNDYRAIAESRIKAKELWDEINPMHPEAIVNLGNLGIIYLDIVRYDSLHLVKYDELIPADKILLLERAGVYLKNAIQFGEQTGEVDNRSFFMGALAEVQEQQGNFRNAYYNYKFFKETEDSIYSQESKNKIAEAESRRTLEINQLALNNQRKTLWGLTGGLALISIIGLLLYRQTQARKKANLQLLHLNKQLDEANQSKARFFALMSHDLRSPVSKLINFLHLQKNEPGLLSPEVKELHNKKITAGAESLLENLENMLLWSKSQMEEFKPISRPVDITQLFEKLQRSFTGYDHLQFTFTNKLSSPVFTDENYLFSILHNLIQNATEALGNVANAQIGCGATEENDRIIFSVKDNGSGYPPQLLNASAGFPDLAGGKKGLGLFMVYDMAAAINAGIILSNTNAGASAVLSLPNRS